MTENPSVNAVLLVEDDADLRALAQTVLEYDGYSVAVAQNGADALRQLEDSQPDLILLDLMMPVMDGLTFLAERRRRRIGEEIPVLCLSAAGQEMMAHAMRLGAKECLHKPADYGDLCDRVSHYCRR